MIYTYIYAYKIDYVYELQTKKDSTVPLIRGKSVIEFF